ncbi:hypothetical protein [Roseicyclus mahoneyensis]|jgi:hypothetical protein|uniref:Uncharacterized protein n=1 Tax=Roseicyclus mahoneyensis TaxID=164332 RepID=A0A316GGN8_9RHOB|nr:hypothetical protein [Roseicyclus mahoneyensis]PWK60209.1 hypothetical protein C7455_105193 [Roseicyclus mahoneyensis]
MKNLFLVTAAALAITAPAFAQNQLETSLGVSAGSFTTAELVQLERAYEENDQTLVNFILSGGSNLDAATSERRGVAAAIERAIEEGDNAHARNLQAVRGVGAADTSVSTRNEAGRNDWLAQVADDLGVNAADFTRGELIALARFEEEGDRIAVNGIISRVRN